RLPNRLLHIRVLDGRDVASEGRVEERRLVRVQLERHRNVQRNRLPLLAVDVDLLVERLPFLRGLREHQRLHEDRILLDPRRERIAQMQPRTERLVVDAAAGTMDHNADVTRVYVLHEIRNQEEQHDDRRYDADQTNDPCARLAATTPTPESHRAEPI